MEENIVYNSEIVQKEFDCAKKKSSNLNLMYNKDKELTCSHTPPRDEYNKSEIVSGNSQNNFADIISAVSRKKGLSPTKEKKYLKVVVNSTESSKFIADVFLEKNNSEDTAVDITKNKRYQYSTTSNVTPTVTPNRQSSIKSPNKIISSKYIFFKPNTKESLKRKYFYKDSIKKTLKISCGDLVKASNIFERGKKKYNLPISSNYLPDFLEMKTRDSIYGQLIKTELKTNLRYKGLKTYGRNKSRDQENSSPERLSAEEAGFIKRDELPKALTPQKRLNSTSSILTTSEEFEDIFKIVRHCKITRRLSASQNNAFGRNISISKLTTTPNQISPSHPQASPSVKEIVKTSPNKRRFSLDVSSSKKKKKESLSYEEPNSGEHEPPVIGSVNEKVPSTKAPAVVNGKNDYSSSGNSVENFDNSEETAPPPKKLVTSTPKIAATPPKSQAKKAKESSDEDEQPKKKLSVATSESLPVKKAQSSSSKEDFLSVLISTFISPEKATAAAPKANKEDVSSEEDSSSEDEALAKAVAATSAPKLAVSVKKDKSSSEGKSSSKENEPTKSVVIAATPKSVPVAAKKAEESSSEEDSSSKKLSAVKVAPKPVAATKKALSSNSEEELNSKEEETPAKPVLAKPETAKATPDKAEESSSEKESSSDEDEALSKPLLAKPAAVNKKESSPSEEEYSSDDDIFLFKPAKLIRTKIDAAKKAAAEDSISKEASSKEDKAPTKPTKRSATVAKKTKSSSEEESSIKEEPAKPSKLQEDRRRQMAAAAESRLNSNEGRGFMDLEAFKAKQRRLAFNKKESSSSEEEYSSDEDKSLFMSAKVIRTKIDAAKKAAVEECISKEPSSEENKAPTKLTKRSATVAKKTKSSSEEESSSYEEPVKPSKIQEECRRQIAAAAESRLKSNQGRGIKDLEAFKAKQRRLEEKQRRLEELERLQQLAGGNMETGMRWQIG